MSRRSSTRHLQHTAAWALAAAMGSATALLWAVAPMAHAAPLPVALPWVVVAGLFYVFEANVAHLKIGGDAHSFSLSEIALVLALLSLPPEGVVAASVAGGGAALVVRRRQRPVKVAFNVAQFALAATLASLVLGQLLAPGDRSIEPATWVAVLAAVLPTSLLGLVLIEAVITLSGCAQRPPLRSVLVAGMTAATANVSVGLVAAIIVAIQPLAVWMLLVPAAVLLLAHRAYVAEHQKRQSIELLYEATKILTSAARVEDAVPALLAHTGTSLGAGFVELTIFPRDAADAALRAWWWPEGGASVLTRLPADPREMVAASVAADGGGIVFGPGSRSGDAHLPDVARRFGGDAIIVAVEGDGGPAGSLVVANPLADVSTFGTEELRLLGTIARHLGIALENGELERSLAALRRGASELRRRALHDSLTGLANRALFDDRLDQAMQRRTTRPVCVMFVDLDDFKAVNDTLGHAAGDEVITTVAARIADCLRPEDTAARIGGDEFALLLEGTGPDVASVVAGRVLRAVRDAVELPDGRVAHVSASIGVAVGQPGSRSADELLGAADAAMYRAKGRGKGTVEVHVAMPELEAASPRDAVLVNEAGR